MACDEFGFNREILVHRMLVAEAHGVMSVTEVSICPLPSPFLIPVAGLSGSCKLCTMLQQFLNPVAV